MPYQFEPYHNRFAPTIGDLLLRQGDIGARQAIEVGNAQARAQDVSGQAWAGAAQNIGHLVGQLPQQLQEARAAQTQNAMRALQLGQAQRQKAGEQAFAGLMQGDQLPPGDAGPRQESFLTSEGLFDVPKITQALGKAGLGDQATALVTSAERINDSILKHQKIEQDGAQQHALLLGDLAHGALEMNKAGTPLAQAMDFVAQPALKTKRITPEDYAKVSQQIAQLPPAQQVAALTALVDQAARIAPGKSLAKDAKEVDRYGRDIASNVVPDKPTEASLAADLSSPDPAVRARARTALDALKPPPNRTAEQDDAKYRDILAARQLKKPITPEDAAWATAYEAQKTITTDKSASAAALRLAAVQAQQTALQQRAQNFTEAQSGRRELTEKVELPYLDAVEKAETLRSVIDAAKGGNMEAAALTPLLATLGVTTAEGVKRINMAEIATVQGAGSLYERIKGQVGKLVAGQPLPAKLQEDITQLANLLEGSARKKYESGFGTITKRYGLKDETIRPAPAAASNAPVSVTSPSGKAYTFPSQAAADAAVADAKAKGLWK